MYLLSSDAVKFSSFHLLIEVNAKVTPTKRNVSHMNFISNSQLDFKSLNIFNLPYSVIET
jgi:hypothetical protein